MKRIAVFAGSFCPFTKGHEDIVRKALPLFDKIIIAIGHNYAKKDVFSVEQRLSWIKAIYANNESIEVVEYQGLTTDLCQRVGAQHLIRGVRNAADFSAEDEMRLVNHHLNPDVETIFIPASPEWSFVSSSLVRELWALKADYSHFLSYTLPEPV